MYQNLDQDRLIFPTKNYHYTYREDLQSEFLDYLCYFRYKSLVQCPDLIKIKLFSSGYKVNNHQFILDCEPLVFRLFVYFHLTSYYNSQTKNVTGHIICFKSGQKSNYNHFCKYVL